MTEENDKDEGRETNGEGRVRNYVDEKESGSEFDTREMPAMEDPDQAGPEGEDTPEGKRGDSEVVDADRPGSEFDTVAEMADEPDETEASHDDVHPFDEDERDTREIPTLKEEWKERAHEVAEALGESADVVGPFEGDNEGDPSLAASVAAASGEMPLPHEDEPSEIAGPILLKAREAQEDWVRHTFEERLPHFQAMLHELVTERSDYVPGMATSIGRPMVEALTGEFLPVLESLRTIEEVVPRLLVDQHSGSAPITHDGTAGSMRLAPYGVVVIVNAAHSPFAFPMTLAIDALATGNAVVICGSESHPRINETMRKLFHRARLPEGLAQVLAGDSETLRAMIEQRPDKLFFEGDEELAMRVAGACAVNDCEFQFVRPAKNTLIVLANADVDHAVSGSLFAAFHSGGMANGAVERIVVHDDIYDEFRMKFIEAIREMNSHHAQLAHIKDAVDPRTAGMLIDDAIGKGARVTYPAGEEPGRWIHWKAVVVEGLSPKARLARTAFEGPGVALYRAKDPVGEARHLLEVAPANNVSVLGEPTGDMMRALEGLPAPRLCIGEPLVTGAGTAGGSPVGSETPRSASGPLAMLRPRVTFTSGQPGPRIAWFPYTDDKAYAMMDAIEWMYGKKAGKRVKGALKLALNPTLRRLLKGRD